MRIHLISTRNSNVTVFDIGQVGLIRAKNMNGMLQFNCGTISHGLGVGKCIRVRRQSGEPGELISGVGWCTGNPAEGIVFEELVILGKA